MKRKQKEDSKRRAKRKRLLEDLREKMEKFERSMESSSSSLDSESSDSDLESEISSNDDRTRDEGEATLKVILGEDPKSTGEKGPPLCEALVNRWSSYLGAGLERDVRDALIVKYKIPENCSLLDAPKLNPEIGASLTPAQIKKDQFSMTIQNKLGRALVAQGSVLNDILVQDSAIQLEDSTKTALADAAKLICEAHYLISFHRKHELYPFLNPEVQKVAMKSNIGGLLFGEDFQEKYKTAREVKKTSWELKAAGPSGYKKEKKSNLNYKRQGNRPRFKTENYVKKNTGRKPSQRYRNLQQPSNQQNHRKGSRKYYN
ncbi:unnamed protein product [Callosobruchus maculatus]|uniref:Uncharacterized protein n=1 Tax=Callosobruchus maculatus TaxID=64391 RepID=A0A653D7Z2_CALMS|nr:unnamed protein product [Callosobruchus maculatus]